MTASFQETKEAPLWAVAGGAGVCDPVRHLPSNRTASGAKRTAAMAPCRNRARIIPGGNLFDRKNTDSTWTATVEMPYTPTQIAPTRCQPRQLERRIR